jgi:uncharacterized protein with HEPN domain
MLPAKERITTILDAAIKEMELLSVMSADIAKPDDFITSLHGMTVYRACGMSLQYITESFVKIRNLAGKDYFKPYKGIPWEQVFGMRNFLSHEYGEVDAEGIFNTVKTDIPLLLETTRAMKQDAVNG